MNSRRSKDWFLGAVTLFLWSFQGSCASQDPPTSLEVFTRFIDHLSPDATLYHVGSAACSDRIEPNPGHTPMVLWTDRNAGAYDGVLVDVFGPGGANFANRLVYFHWNIAKTSMVLLLHDNIVLDSTELSWSSPQEQVFAAVMFGPDHEPIAEILFGALYNKGLQQEEDAVVFFRMTEDGLQELTDVIGPLTVTQDTCFLESSTSLDLLLVEVLARRTKLRSSDYTASQAGRSTIIGRFLGLARN